MIIETKGLIKVYNGRKVVNDVSISVEQGSIVGLLGPNGAGKTTTFYMIVGIAKPDQGTVTIDGVDIGHLPMCERAKKGIGYLPQEASIFRKLTVEDNLRAILETTELTREEQTGHGIATLLSGPIGLDVQTRQDRRRLAAAAARMVIDGLRPPGTY